MPHLQLGTPVVRRRDNPNVQLVQEPADFADAPNGRLIERPEAS